MSSQATGQDSFLKEFADDFIKYVGGPGGIGKSGVFADFVIRCNEARFGSHNIILSARSEYFRKVCDSDFKESTESSIDLSDDEPMVIKFMLDFIYGAAYASSESDAVFITKNESSMSLHAKLYAAGDRYMIPSLKQYALVKYESAISMLGSEELVDNISTIFLSPILTCFTELKEPLFHETQNRIHDLVNLENFNDFVSYDNHGFVSEFIMYCVQSGSFNNGNDKDHDQEPAPERRSARKRKLPKAMLDLDWTMHS